MKKAVFIVIILLVCHHCFSQEETQQKKPFTYSVGLSYNQIWLQSYMYGADEYGVSSSPFNWGITPFFSMSKGRFSLYSGILFSSCQRTKEDFPTIYFGTNIQHDTWQEMGVACAGGFRVTGENSFISVSPFLGIDLTYLINYETDVITDYYTKHYNTHELGARNPYNFFSYYLGIGLLGGINVSCPITKHFEIGLSYCFKYKIVNNIRSDHNPHFPAYVTSPYYYHNANIGVSYRFD